MACYHSYDQELKYLRNLLNTVSSDVEILNQDDEEEYNRNNDSSIEMQSDE